MFQPMNHSILQPARQLVRWPVVVCVLNSRSFVPDHRRRRLGRFPSRTFDQAVRLGVELVELVRSQAQQPCERVGFFAKAAYFSAVRRDLFGGAVMARASQSSVLSRDRRRQRKQHSRCRRGLDKVGRVRPSLVPRTLDPPHRACREERTK